MDLSKAIDDFAAFHEIGADKTFTLPFKLEDGRLYAMYDGEWLLLMRKNKSFYMMSSLRRMYKAPFINALFKNLRERVSDDLIAFSDDVRLPPQPPEPPPSILDAPILEAQKYTVIVNVTFRPDANSYVETLRGAATLTPFERESFKLALHEPTEFGNIVVRELFEKMDMLDWFEHRGSAAPSINVESITLDEMGIDNMNLSNTAVSCGSDPVVYTKWSDCTQLWDSPEFRPNRCMLSAFLGKFKRILEARRIHPHPDLNYEGLWRLSKPNAPYPLDNEPWAMTWADAEVWLNKWHIPGLMVDIHGKVRCRYEPSRPNQNIEHARFDVIMHNEHVWLINKNTNLFAYKFRNKPIELAPPQLRDSNELSDKWPRPSVKDQIIHCVDGVDEIMDIYNEVSNRGNIIITSEEPENLIRELVEEYDIEPGKVICRNGKVDGFSIMKSLERNKEIDIRVKRALDGDIVGDQPDDRKKWTIQRHINVMQWIEWLSAEVLPKAGISSYSPDLTRLFDNYRRGPLCLSWRANHLRVADKNNVLGIDVARAYTSIIRDIKKIPVFSKFDRFNPISVTRPALSRWGVDAKNPEKPHEMAFYAIRVKKIDPILFPDKEDFVPYSVLEYALSQGMDVEMLGQVVPHKVVAVNPGLVLERMYNSDLQDSDKKYIANLVYGLAGRKYNKSAFGQLYQDEKEAKLFSMNKMKVSLTPDLHLVIEQLKRTLSEGYRPVAHMILNGMRVLLHKMVSALGSENVLGVMTDCVYTSLSEEAASQRLSGFRFKSTGGFEDIGSLRFTRGKLPTLGMMDRDTPHVPPSPPAFSMQQQLTMKDEFSDEEARQIIESGSPLLVVGKYPGTGKSRLALHWGKDRGLLVVCPTNALCDELKIRKHKTITTHTLLGKRPVDDTDEKQYKPFDVSEYSAVLFEEVFFYPVYQLEWIADFMKKHPDKTYIANGDPAQNEPVCQTLNVNFDDYYNEILAQMFPRRLNLKISKRYNDQDRERMELLYRELLCPGGQLPFDKAAKYLNVTEWEVLKQDEEAAFYPHVAFTNDSVDRVNNWVQKVRHPQDPDKWRVGDVCIGRRYGRVAQKRKINSNAVYTIQEISDTHLTIRGKDDCDRVLTIASSTKLLRRPWCQTGHSIQGQTLGNKLYIHDAQTAMATARWLRTAVTRCQTLDITLVKYKDPMRVPKRIIENRIRNHIQADTKSNRTFTLDANYVSFSWARQQIILQSYACAVCQSPLDKDWSIDRIDNARAHINTNCQISCRSCQHASSHR